MLIPGCTETESRSEIQDVIQLLRPLRVHLKTAADPGPREVTAPSLIDQYAKVATPMWITAEVGAGATWLAQALFERSQQGGAFVRQECEDGVAPVLPAGRGMVFLSHPERLTFEHQEQLVQYLKRSDMQHLEGLRTIQPMPRVIVWTTQTAEQLVGTGQLLPALGQILSRLSLSIPPLREQAESIAVFAQAVLDQVTAHEGLTARTLGHDTLALLQTYDWPGNLAELHSILERAVLLADPSHAVLEARDLPQQLTQAALPHTASAPHEPAATPKRHVPRTMQEIEAEAIRGAIEHNNGNLVRAARELQIGRATLYRKLKKYGIPTRSERRQQLMR